MAVAFRSRMWIGLFGVVVVISGCNSSPLPPPPTSPASVPAAPSVAPQPEPSPSTSRPPVPRPESPAPSTSAKPSSPEASTKAATASLLADSQPKVTSAPKAPVAIGKRVEGPAAAGNFIVALARDLDGNVWVGTEDKGVLRGTPNGEWTQFTTKDGLGDDNGYALCCDRLGRVWVGQLNHGVAVFNGESWKTYDVLDGPLGERIFDIACCPTDGDVWLATSAGLSRYSEKTDLWSYFTRADGLPSDQTNALAFAPDGTLYVGTQCDGVAIGRADDNYAKWQVVTAAQSDDHYRRPTGKGLPSNLINDVLVASDGTVYVATSLGLAKSKNQGQAWEYIRGRDYADKVKGRAEPPPKTWSPLPKDKLAALLPEDYITSLAEDNAGRLWLGFRQQGFGVIDPKSGASFHGTKDAAKLKDTYITALLPDDTGRALLGGYGGGAMTLKDEIPTAMAKLGDFVKASPSQTQRKTTHPSRLCFPDSVELARIRTELAASVRLSMPKLMSLNDDWRTQGTWIGRYGRFGGVQCAIGGGGCDSVTGEQGAWFEYQAWMGRNFKEPGDELRYWVHWITTEDRRSLQYESRGGRKQSEWDDHGEAYPMSLDGPHIYSTFRLPRGSYVVSCYFFNKDGHSGSNRWRDFLVDLRPTPMTETVFKGLGDGTYADHIFDRSKGVSQRVQDFWGGVYKRFFIRIDEESECYTVRVSRNHSFNTILSAIFVDEAGTGCGEFGPFQTPARPRLPKTIDDSCRLDQSAQTAFELLDEALCLRDANPAFSTAMGRRLQLRLTQLLLDRDGPNPCLAAQIDACPSLSVREDVASLLDSLQLLERSDSVYFKPNHFALWAWQCRTRNGGWTFTPQDRSQESFDRFMRDNQKGPPW